MGRTNLKISLQVEFMISTSMSHRNCCVAPLRLTNSGRNKMVAIFPDDVLKWIFFNRKFMNLDLNLIEF